jgi:hypothetical protein
MNPQQSSDLCGFRVEYTKRAWEPKRYVGMPRKLNDNGEGDWREEDMSHFEIDGPGGEFITVVEIGWEELPVALKVLTSSSVMTEAAESS